MSREIKFRAWDKKNNRMMTSNQDVFYVESDGSCHETEPDIGPYDRLVSIDIELMQFTGLHDSEGEEIYEGDIVCRKYTGGSTKGEEMPNSRSVVRIGVCEDMTINCNEYSVDYCGVWAEKIGSESFFDLDNESCCDFESWTVIGNKYENQELLEG